MSKQQAFGTWASPITPELVTSAGVRLGDVAYQNGAAFWAESRPQDDGRCTIVKARLGLPAVDITSEPFNVRTRVHEYGGGSWWVDDQYLYFVNWTDQRLYRVDHVSVIALQPEALTSVPDTSQAHRYADGCVSRDGLWIVCVHEQHVPDARQVLNQIVAVPNRAVTEKRTVGDAQYIKPLATGADFYSTPRLSADGRYLSWIQWSHPQMPWDGTELMLADVHDDMSVHNIRKITGDTDVSVMGAMWSANGTLIYASDQSGWWNLYQYIPATTSTEPLTQFTDREVGTPAWVFGTQRFVELHEDTSNAANNSAEANSSVRLALVVTHQARDELHVRNSDGLIKVVDVPYTSISSIVADQQGRVLIQGQTEKQSSSVGFIDCHSNTDTSTGKSAHMELKPADDLPFDEAWLSAPHSITFVSDHHNAHAFFYPPAGHDLTGLPDELPPLVVMGHGGPTSHATAGLKLAIQYWTSRGIAVVDVNYGGSSGFGRDYRRRLNGEWGVVDVRDCIAVTKYLANNGLVDKSRMVIRGGSAGGLTVLRALQTSTAFAGGTSLYGVTDLEMLAVDTHKFESRYLDGLLGGSYPEHKNTYIERSPIHHADQLNCPILVLQGDEDKVVPPNQSAAIVEAAAAKGLPHAYILFAGEQHGFRQTENIIRALQIELWFYGRVLGFEPVDDIDAPEEAVGL